MSSQITVYDDLGSPQVLTGEDVKNLLRPQTWQDVTASRSANVTYTNTTGKPIFLMTRYTGGTTRDLTIDDVVHRVIVATGSNFGHSAMIPNGSTYSISGSATTWLELR